jgi:hypothetical protein
MGSKKPDPKLKRSLTPQSNGLPGIITRPPLQQMQAVQVFDEGEDVVLRIGDSELRWHYTQALALSQHVRVCAKRAKNRAGDQSRHWSAVADLVDANKPEG